MINVILMLVFFSNLKHWWVLQTLQEHYLFFYHYSMTLHKPLENFPKYSENVVCYMGAYFKQVKGETAASTWLFSLSHSQCTLRKMWGVCVWSCIRNKGLWRQTQTHMGVFSHLATVCHSIANWTERLVCVCVSWRRLLGRSCRM